MRVHTDLFEIYETGGAAAYWEARARRFADAGGGLRAVCSCGMPAFHNAAIHLAQRRALGPWLRPARDTRALDAGCGVGRWSRLLAGRGARVVGVDLSPTMVAEAERRAAAAGLADRLTARVGDLRHLDLGRRFDLVLAVTVLQHLASRRDVAAAVDGLARHLAPGGRMVVLEAAPTAASTRCDSAVFQARSASFYLELFAEAELRLERLAGVDPAPLRTLVLPYYPRLPRFLAAALLAAATAAALPVDLALGRHWPAASWHKVFVLRRTRDA